MPFRYYERLSRAQKAIYDRSDRIAEVHLPGAEPLRRLVAALSGSLASEERDRVEIACQRLLAELTRALGVGPVRVTVLSVRPHRGWGELHGLYTESGGALPPKITLWMRTAQQRRVVAFRTFLRTLLHEFCHHLDYRLFRLKDSYHTEGFYKREASLFHQLIPQQEALDGRPDLRDHEPRPAAKHLW